MESKRLPDTGQSFWGTDENPHPPVSIESRFSPEQKAEMVRKMLEDYDKATKFEQAKAGLDRWLD